MRLDVVERQSEAPQRGGEGAHLVEHQVLDLGRGELHLASTEAHEVGQPRMRAHPHAVLGRGLDGGRHGVRIPGVEAARHVRHIDDSHQREVVAEAVQPERFAEIGVDGDRAGVAGVRDLR